MHDREEAATLVKVLRDGRFEFGLSMAQLIYYWLERQVCHALLRRPPPDMPKPALLNLGCGPHIYEGWVNGDDYALKRRFRDKAFRPNWHLDISRAWQCPNNHWEGIFTEHVIEHVTYSEAVLVFEEARRTLKPGAWIRISVPDLKKYVAYYIGDRAGASLGNFPHPAVAVSFITQMHLHRSVWDGELIVKVLAELGYVDVKVVAFGKGSDQRLIKDDPNKVHESLYVEARKP